MNDFTFYFVLGWDHIVSWESLDHILFIVALAAIYLVNDWKQVLILVTAFTMGHSVTLALSVLEIVKLKTSWVEFMIPLTIVATGIYNLTLKHFDRKTFRLNYLFALVFGLIHGLGFANAIRFMLYKNQELLVPLFGFNIGLEAGQILFVIAILGFSYLFVNKLSIKRCYWVNALSLTTIFTGAYLGFERWPI